MYLEILARNSQVYNTDVLGYCLLKDQVHLVVVPHKKAALSNMVARTHFDYTRYMNAKRKSSGALWYDRFHSCILDDSKLQQSIQFVDQMAAQKKLVRGAAQYKWSSAAAHVKGKDSYEVLDLKAWPPARLKKQWAKTISAKMEPELGEEILAAARAGRPLGSDAFIDKLEKKFRCRLRALPVGRPPKS